MEETQRKIKLLLADDEVEFLDATVKALSRRGFEVASARNGEEALNLLKARDFDVVVLDVKMPGLDGVEVFRRLKTHFPDLPVILLTGHGTIYQAFETSREGVFDYLTKPCPIEEIVEVARKAAASRRRRDAESICEPEGEGKGEIRLLFVDDEPELLSSLSAALSRRGMRVTTAPGATEALALAQNQLFDVALIDLKMPGMDGLELLRRLKRSHPLIEIVVLTGHPTTTKAFQAVKDGAVEFLMKPQSVESLTTTLREAYGKHLRRRQQSAEDTVKRILEGRPD